MKRTSSQTKQAKRKSIRVRVKQSANATINQGGNAFAINASEIGIVRIVPGQQR